MVKLEIEITRKPRTTLACYHKQNRHRSRANLVQHSRVITSKKDIRSLRASGDLLLQYHDALSLVFWKQRDLLIREAEDLHN